MVKATSGHTKGLHWIAVYCRCLPLRPAASTVLLIMALNLCIIWSCKCHVNQALFLGNPIPVAENRYLSWYYYIKKPSHILELPGHRIFICDALQCQRVQITIERYLPWTSTIKKNNHKIQGTSAARTITCNLGRSYANASRLAQQSNFPTSRTYHQKCREKKKHAKFWLRAVPRLCLL